MDANRVTSASLKETARELEGVWRRKAQADFDAADPEKQKQMFYDIYDMQVERKKYFGHILLMFSKLSGMSNISGIMFHDLVHLGLTILIPLTKDDFRLVEEKFRLFLEKYPEFKEE